MRIPNNLKIAVPLIVLAVAIITPTVDPFTLMAVSAPALGLYVAGFVLGQQKQRSQPTN
jgi:Sec-independent protein secretion pathway component TatC